ncbi:MAG TPA: YceI family protein [Dehalococcoidia bacterium]|nr:YceI family protein [Dehalococcoidia bacterium]
MKRPRPFVLVGATAAVIALVVVSAAVVWTLRSDDPDLLTEAPAIPTSAPSGVDESPTQEPEDAASTAAEIDLPEGVRRFIIVPGDSSAKYVVEETLSGLPATAVGVTTDVTGEIYLTSEGLYDGAESKFMVDLSTLKTDESRRDNFVRDNVLQTREFQFAEFVIESVDGFPSGYVEGDEASLTLTGTMTIKDVSLPMTFTVLARQADDTLTATADTEFNMSDFGIDPPQVAIAKAKDGVVLQVVLIAREPAA